MICVSPLLNSFIVQEREGKQSFKLSPEIKKEKSKEEMISWFSPTIPIHWKIIQLSKTEIVL